MTEQDLTGWLKDFEARLEEAKQRHSRTYRDMSYIPPKAPRTPEVPKPPEVKVKWADVRPDREDVDSWATRLGATVIFSELLARREQLEGMERHAEVAVYVTSVLLCISVLIPVGNAIRKATIDYANPYNLKIFVATGFYITALAASAIAMWPYFAQLFNRFFDEFAFRNKVFLAAFVFVAAIGFYNRRKRKCRVHRLPRSAGATTPGNDTQRTRAYPNAFPSGLPQPPRLPSLHEGASSSGVAGPGKPGWKTAPTSEIATQAR